MIVEKLQNAHNQYFNLMIKEYSQFSSSNELVVDLGPSELCELAIEVHACAIALGPVVRDRLCYLGLDLLYPFDNPVDHFNWRVQVKKDRIPHTIYASIAVRIDAELKRIRQVLEIHSDLPYSDLPIDLFLVSKTRYPISASEITSENDNSNAAKLCSAVTPQVGTVNNYFAADSNAVSQLEKLEKKTSIFSNVSNITAFLRSILGA
ncbi:MAG: hypothetical protein ACXVBZ_14785 [Flavisolibacter sp.]